MVVEANKSEMKTLSYNLKWLTDLAWLLLNKINKIFDAKTLLYILK